MLGRSDEVVMLVLGKKAIVHGRDSECYSGCLAGRMNESIPKNLEMNRVSACKVASY